ncbi:MAG TPA: contractile injection system protein, VgrG/Pvc8 family [Pyrinomonadaceae bacterium]|nr:contractile injection system protein, VgrG/Pvc8 family [Pyrinomonadaceae bacterium]
MPQLSIPDFEILINGTTLPVDAAAHVVEVSVEEDTELPGMFSLEVVASDDLENVFQWVDDTSLFAVGNVVEVKLGYVGQLTSVFKGELTGLEPSFSSERLPTLIVRGYDRRHRLTRGRHTRSFLKKKDSDIAAQIAREAGLTPQVTDSKVTHDYVLQANQTDYEFLIERAARIQYEVVVEDKTLNFHPVANDKGAAITLKADEDLTEFHPRLSSVGQVSETAVRGWDPKNKKEILGKAQAGDEVSTMGGQQASAALSKKAFGVATALLSNLPVTTQAEADQIAIARFNNAALELITGDAVCDGRADLRPGKVVKVDGVGKRFGGQYYVTAATHVYTPDGYSTRFSFRRNAL